MVNVSKYKLILNKSYELLFLFYMINVFFISSVQWQIDSKLLNYLRIGSLFIYLCLFVALYLMELVISKNLIYYILIIPTIIILLGIAGMNVKDNALVLNTMMIFLAKNIDFNKIANLFFKFFLVSLIVIILFSQIGLTSDVMFNFSYGTGHSLGFPHPNNLGMAVLVLILAWLYLNYFRNIKIIFLVSYVGALFDLSVPLSRTSAVILLVAPWILLIYRYSDKLKLNRLYYISSFFPLFIYILSIILMFKIQLGSVINSYSSFLVRFTEGKSLFETYGIHLLGSNIHFIGSIEAQILGVSPVILDCAYLRLLIYYGIVPSIIMLILFLVLGHRIYKSNNQILMVIMILFFISGLMERDTLFVQWNFVLLATFAALTPKELSK